MKILRTRTRKGLAAMVTPLLALTIMSGGSARAAVPFAPINHMVVLMQENRSFDNYLGHLNAYQVAKHGSSTVEPEPTTGIHGITDATEKPFHQTHMCEVADLDHSWTGTHNEWNGGAMDGFAIQNATTADPTGSRTMGYYTEQELPYYYGLYDTFAMSDTYFASALTQTFPNRFYLLAGTSFGHIGNDFPIPPANNNPTTNPAMNDFQQKTIFDKLDGAGVSWKVYYAQIAFALEFGTPRNEAVGHIFPITQYYADAAAGLLPAVSFIDPIFLGPVNVENDEHPPTNVQLGQKFVHDLLGALMTSPNWSDSAAFLTYDEHGGFYDHVAPPKAVLPDAIGPMGRPVSEAFDHLGVRTPFAVISPYSKPHYNSSALPYTGTSDPVYSAPSKIYSHTSILRSIEDRFTIPAGQTYLTARDAASNNAADLFDFSHAAFSSPPALPDATIDPAELVYCEQHDHVPTGL